MNDEMIFEHGQLDLFIPSEKRELFKKAKKKVLDRFHPYPCSGGPNYDFHQNENISFDEIAKRNDETYFLEKYFKKDEG